MKKSINAAGIIFLLILMIGIVFKRMHFPGAGVLSTLGIFLFATVYIPVFLVSLSKQMKAEGSNKNRVLLLLGFPGIIALTFGSLAKIMHWPGAAKGLWGGIGLLTLVLLLFMLLNRKSNEKLSMISVLIVIIVLGSFSFNTFRIGHIRNLNDANTINGASFSESSKLIWAECENIMRDKILSDTSQVNAQVRNELITLHALIQESDLLIGGMLEKIRIMESEAIYVQEPNKEKVNPWYQLNQIVMDEEGLPKLDRNLTECRNLIVSQNRIPTTEAEKIADQLVYPYQWENSGIQHKYLFSNDFSLETSVHALLLWKSRIWEVEYEVLSAVLKK